MSTEELRKAVERALVRMERDDPQGVRYVRQVLRDQEAEVAHLNERLLVLRGGHDLAINRAEKAEALLRFLRYRFGGYMDESDKRAITAHLGATHD